MVNDDDDVLTLLIAHFPEILPVVTKPGCSKNAPQWEKTNRHEMVRTAVPYQFVRETVLTSWDIPSPITCNQLTPGTYPWRYMYTRRKKKKDEERKERRKKEK